MLIDEIKAKELLNLASLAKMRAYSPYSNFKVGSALLSTNGTITTGCNVENASYGLTICAERNAIFSAVNQGFTKGDFVAIAIAASSKNFSPCGACRQVIAEFGDDILVIFEFNGELQIKKAKELLPFSFEL